MPFFLARAALYFVGWLTVAFFLNRWSRAQEAKFAALRYILDAWEEAVYDGLDPDCIATAAIFAALSDMIATYGEEPVASMALSRQHSASARSPAKMNQLCW